MRSIFTLGVVLLLAIGTTGCSNNQPQAEQLAQQLIDSFNGMSDSMEKGDKSGVKATFAKMTDIAKKAKELKLTKDQDKAVEAKFKPQMEAATKRMMDSMMKAATSGKLTPADMMEIQKDAQDFAAAAKQK